MKLIDGYCVEESTHDDDNYCMIKSMSNIEKCLYLNDNSLSLSDCKGTQNQLFQLHSNCTISSSADTLTHNESMHSNLCIESSSFGTISMQSCLKKLDSDTVYKLKANNNPIELNNLTLFQQRILHQKFSYRIAEKTIINEMMTCNEDSISSQTPSPTLSKTINNYDSVPTSIRKVMEEAHRMNG